MQRNCWLGRLDAVVADYAAIAVQIESLSRVQGFEEGGELRERVARVARRAREICDQARIGIARCR